MQFSSTIAYAEGFEPGYLGRISQLHGEYYLKVWGAGPLFEAQMARGLCDFCESYDPEQDLLLTTHVNGVLAGSIAIIGPREGSPVQLRWFLLAEECQGHGVGRTLLHRALEFCRERGYEKVFLWTVEGLPQSRHLYESVGFRVVESVWDNRYSVPHNNLKFELVLDAEVAP